MRSRSIVPNFSNHAKKAKTEWYDFSNVKSSKMLSFDSVAEAYGLIYPRPWGKNVNFVVLFMSDDGFEIDPKDNMHLSFIVVV